MFTVDEFRSSHLSVIIVTVTRKIRVTLSNVKNDAVPNTHLYLEHPLRPGGPGERAGSGVLSKEQYEEDLSGLE